MKRFNPDNLIAGLILALAVASVGLFVIIDRPDTGESIDENQSRDISADESPLADLSQAPNEPDQTTDSKAGSNLEDADKPVLPNLDYRVSIYEIEDDGDRNLLGEARVDSSGDWLFRSLVNGETIDYVLIYPDFFVFDTVGAKWQRYDLTSQQHDVAFGDFLYTNSDLDDFWQSKPSKSIVDCPEYGECVEYRGQIDETQAEVVVDIQSRVVYSIQTQDVAGDNEYVYSYQDVEVFAPIDYLDVE